MDKFMESPRRMWIFFAIVIFLFLGSLGGRELWTHEARWGLICQEMMRTGDFLHPYLQGEPYYDKPLPSYWLMIAFAKLLGGLSEWALRLPSVLSALLVLCGIFVLARTILNEKSAWLSVWILLSTPEFIFWGRVATADMLNVAGVVWAVAWYFLKRDRPDFRNLSVFFLIMSLTSLMKGLTGFVFPLLMIFPDLLRNKRWKTLFSPQLFFALIPGILLYLVPFGLSNWMGGKGYSQTGLDLVFRENILRYFQAFDHQGHWYTYLQYLPLYFFPWVLIWIFGLKKVWKNYWSTPYNGFAWVIESFLVIFIFLSLSGSRRSYYLLPLVPFAALWTAHQIALFENEKLKKISCNLILIFCSGILLWSNVFGPVLEKKEGVKTFLSELNQELRKTGREKAWSYVLFHPLAKTGFYLKSSVPPVWIMDNSQGKKVADLSLGKKEVIIITCHKLESQLDSFLSGYRKIKERPKLLDKFRTKTNSEALVAYLPLSK